ncbi:MAG: ADP-ribosylglycohydrolase family protein [Woeseiaceae bacterium]|nr:ADP-ribosylglycohydrolase family protein [Woeseiaceae bacterium]
MDPSRIRAAWIGRISGCLLGKPIEVLSFREGPDGVEDYLRRTDALPLRDYIPLEIGSLVDERGRDCCRGAFNRAEPDDDINYTLLALVMLEQHGLALSVADVARTWLNRLPAGATWTAERSAYQVLLNEMDPEFVNGDDAGFDLGQCSDNEFNEWIGAQIRVDLYGWVCPGQPELAARLARTDASLSHRGEALHCAAFVAALGAALAVSDNVDSAVDVACGEIPAESRAMEAVSFARSVAGRPDAVKLLHERYRDLSPVHSLNNLALVVWAITSADGDFSRAVGDVVAAGWDTDCNGATVGGLYGIAGVDIPEHWSAPWQGRVAFSMAGTSEIPLTELVERTVTVANSLEHEHNVH